MPLTDEVPVRRRQGLQEESSRQRRAKILDAAEAAFLDRGFSAASLRDVAARASISHTGLLHHYPDKNALLEALLDDRLSGLSAVLPFDASDGASFLRSIIGARRPRCWRARKAASRYDAHRRESEPRPPRARILPALAQAGARRAHGGAFQPRERRQASSGIHPRGGSNASVDDAGGSAYPVASGSDGFRSSRSCAIADGRFRRSQPPDDWTGPMTTPIFADAAP